MDLGQTLISKINHLKNIKYINSLRNGKIIYEYKQYR